MKKKDQKAKFNRKLENNLKELYEDLNLAQSFNMFKSFNHKKDNSMVI